MIKVMSAWSVLNQHHSNKFPLVYPILLGSSTCTHETKGIWWKSKPYNSYCLYVAQQLILFIVRNISVLDNKRIVISLSLDNLPGCSVQKCLLSHRLPYFLTMFFNTKDIVFKVHRPYFIILREEDSNPCSGSNTVRKIER